MINESDRPWEDVTDPRYFKGVMRNMIKLKLGPSSGGAGRVKFGRTGIGHSPNYQIEGQHGAKYLFNGMGHSDAWHIEDEFSEDHLSEQFTFEQVQAMLGRLLGR